MKRFLAAALALLLLTLAGCGLIPAPRPEPPAPTGTPAGVLVTLPPTAVPTPTVPPAETRAPSEAEAPAQTDRPENVLPEDGSYTTAEDVALYLHRYGHLPGNFITKNEARKLGWTGGSLEPYAPGKCIGGDRFGNYEGLLPKGHAYTECDIDTLGAAGRGAKRIIFSADGLIFYTEDHYESFVQLYGPGDP